MKYAIALCVLVFAFGCSPSPESFAAATATLMRAQSIQSESELGLSATATMQSIAAGAAMTAAHGTAVSINQQAQATATAVPYQAQVAATNPVNAWSWSALGMGAAGLVISIALCALAFAALVRMRGRNIPRGKDGQLPAVWQNGTIVDPSRMVGPTATVVRPDLVWQIARAVDYLRTGRVAPLPEPRILLADGGANAEQLLEAAKSANATAAVAALMRPGQSTAEKNARMEMVQKGAMRGPWGEVRPPETRVIANGDDAIRIIAEHLGDRLPKGVFGQGPAMPAPEPPAGFLDPPAETVESAWTEGETVEEKEPREKDDAKT